VCGSVMCSVVRKAVSRIFTLTIILFLCGCGDKLTWQETLCEKSIRLEARYGYDLLDIGSKTNTLLNNVTDVVGTVTIKDGFGASKVQSFRCSINNGQEEILTPEEVRVWIY